MENEPLGLVFGQMPSSSAADCSFPRLSVEEISPRVDGGRGWEGPKAATKSSVSVLLVDHASPNLSQLATLSLDMLQKLHSKVNLWTAGSMMFVQYRARAWHTCSRYQYLVKWVSYACNHGHLNGACLSTISVTVIRAHGIRADSEKPRLEDVGVRTPKNDQEPKKNPKAKNSHEQHQRIFWTTVEFKIIPYRVLFFLNYLPYIFFQDWVGWELFTVIFQEFRKLSLTVSSSWVFGPAFCLERPHKEDSGDLLQLSLQTMASCAQWP